MPQRLAFHVRHHVIRGAVNLPGVNEAEDVWMLQVGDCPDLAEKSVAPGHGHQFGPQNLDRDLAGVPEVPGKIDCRHAADAERREEGAEPYRCVGCGLTSSPPCMIAHPAYVPSHKG